MEIIICWLVLSIIVAFVGTGRKIGFLGALFTSLLLSPLIGLIITALSKNKQTEAFEKAYMKNTAKKTKPTKVDFETLDKALKARLIKQPEYDDLLSDLRARS